NTEGVRSRRHDQLSTYGLLKDVPKADLRDWVFQLIGQGVLVVSDGEYPVLKLNAASWAVMNGERQARLIRLAKREERPGGREAAAGTNGGLPEGADPELFELLRQIRRQEATRAQMQPYQVFPDTVLAEMARGRPTTEDALRRITGVGEYRLRSF